tara:strand:- start:435 stop:1571 length:1137 start_codon:yes stop_codon:yes gene_type:complete
MGMILRYLFSTFFFLFLSNLSFASQFNYGTEFAAISPNAHKTTMTAMEKSGDRIFAVGIHGIIVYSDDEGNSWTQAKEVPFKKTLTDISCPSQNKCWATGHDATILHSFDGGETWQIQYQDIDFDAPLLSIHMYDDYEGVALGAFALSLRTANGGISWDYLFIDDDEFQPHLNYTYGDNQAWRKSARDEGYAVGELGKYYVTNDRGLNWLAIETGYFGSYWSGIKVDEGQSLLLGMSGNITLATLYGLNDEVPPEKSTAIACYESGYYRGDCKVYAFDDLFIGTKNSLTNAQLLEDGRIVLSGNGGVVSVIDMIRNKNIKTCVRSDRLSNTAVIPLGIDDFLIAGENGVRKHSMDECYKNFVSEDTSSQDSYYEISIN